MNRLVDELKTRARIGLNALKRGETGPLDRARAVSGRRIEAPCEWKLRHALGLVAQGVGFAGWDHARTVLGGSAKPGDDFGRFWNGPGCDTLLNHWFSRHDEAAAQQRAAPGRFLLPYARQFVVVGPEYLQALGAWDALTPQDREGFDAVAAIGSEAWLRWCDARLRAPLTCWASPERPPRRAAVPLRAAP